MDCLELGRSEWAIESGYRAEDVDVVRIECAFVRIFDGLREVCDVDGEECSGEDGSLGDGVLERKRIRGVVFDFTLGVAFSQE